MDGPAQEREIPAELPAREPKVGLPTDDGTQRNRQTETGQPSAHASMRAHAERDVTIRFPGQIKPIGIGKLLRVAICRA